MAESSSSVEESSKEEEHDEVSPNLHRPASPIDAASKASEKKPGLFSERGYLKTLSRQERRRIKREIRKGRKLGEMNLDLCILNELPFKVTGDSLHPEIFASTEPFVSRQRKLL